MKFTGPDVAIFIVFYLAVLAFSFFKSRGRKDSADYFLGGRALPWWLIGVSVVAANISSEQFVGMAGQAAGDVGLAVSAWQLTGIIGIVVIAFTFLPRFLRAGIYTIPEFLEYRYNAACRTIMSVLTVIIYASVTTAAVLYAGATTLQTVFGMPIGWSIFLLAAIAMVYIVWGGLLAAVWADLIQGAALLIGGLVTIWIGVKACGGPTTFFAKNADKFHMVLPQSHPELPWRVLLSGMWIPIIYYCGLNQFIMQRTLAAKSLKQAQLGVVFCGALWLLVPIGIVMPGIVAHQLYGHEMTKSDQAYPMLIKHLIPDGLRGFIFAALAGAVISTLASVLNSASTIFTMDLYKRYINPHAAERRLVLVGRVSTVVFLAIACIVAQSDLLEGGVFKFIQEFQGYVSPGIVAAFLFGFAVKRAPSAAGIAALLLSAPIYGALDFFWGKQLVYLDRMFITLLALLAVMAVITLVAPLDEPRVIPNNRPLEGGSSPWVVTCGILVILAAASFFVIFR